MSKEPDMYVVVHSHRHGVSTYHCTCTRWPKQDELIRLFDLNFEPERDEDITWDKVSDVKELKV